MVDKQPGEADAVQTDNLEHAVAVHIAEYNALTTRITYWLSVQIGLWPVVFLIIGFGAQWWSNTSPGDRANCIWSTFILIHVIALLWAEITLEVFRVIRYIEHHLRPRVEKDANLKWFWKYETSLAIERPNTPSLVEYGAALAGTGILTAVLILLPPETLVQYALAGANVIFVGLHWYNVKRIFRARLDCVTNREI